MTKDVIELAREAGMEVHERKGQIRIGSAVLTGCDSTDSVIRLAALVAAQIKERCAQICESEWSNIAEKMYGAQLAAAIRALNTEGNDATTAQKGGE